MDPATPAKTLATVLDGAGAFLAKYGVDSPRATAEFLAARLLALAPLGAAAAGLCAAALRGLDWLSVNVEPEEDDDESLDWCA